MIDKLMSGFSLEGKTEATNFEFYFMQLSSTVNFVSLKPTNEAFTYKALHSKVFKKKDKPAAPAALPLMSILGCGYARK